MLIAFDFAGLGRDAYRKLTHYDAEQQEREFRARYAREWTD
jgi:hypothetical protein